LDGVAGLADATPVEVAGEPAYWDGVVLCG
jgi:hypothetical protein